MLVDEEVQEEHEKHEQEELLPNQLTNYY